MQRIFDVVFSALALVLLSPLLIPVAIILRFTGEGDVFFVQKRVGKGGQNFGLIKFASMLRDSPKLGSGEITLKDDPRVLPVGKFLRKTKINELPQIYNILSGDMSVVGPRPMVPNTFLQYKEDGKLIGQLRPGLTGIGSIVFRDEEQFLANHADPMAFYKEIIIPYKVKLELWYLDNRSLTLYFTLIFITAWVVVFPNSNIHQRLLKGLPPLPAELSG